MDILKTFTLMSTCDVEEENCLLIVYSKYGLFFRNANMINCSPCPILHCLIFMGEESTIEMFVDIDIILN